MSYSSTVLAESPTLYWRLGESSGTTATDASTGSHNGTYGAGITLAAAGGVVGDSNTAVTSQATSTSKITSSYAVWTTGLIFTVKGLAKRTNTSGFHTLWGGDGGGGAPSLRCSSGSEDVRFAIRDNDGGATSAATWTAAWPGTGVWVHWALVGNLTAHTAELYINGASKGQVTGLTQTLSVPGNFLAGCTGSTFFNNWVGQIDEVAFNTSALSAATILNDYVVARSYIDSASGAITSSGTKSDSKTVSDSVGGTLSPSGAMTELSQYLDTRAGSISLSGLNSEIDVYADIVQGSVGLTLNMREAYDTYNGRGTASYSNGGVATYDEEY